MKDKIPFYNIVNMFFVGAVFFLCLVFLLYEYIPFDLIKENSELLSDWSILVSVALLIVMYELGFIINRMGSVIIAPVYQCKKLKIWPIDDYGIDVSIIEKSNPRFQSMVTELVLMRSHIMMCFLLMVISLVLRKWIWCGSLIALVVVFTLGGKRHNSKLNTIRKDYSQRKTNEEQEAKILKDYLSFN